MEELNDEEQKQFEIYCRRLLSAAKRLQEEEKKSKRTLRRVAFGEQEKQS